MEAHKQKINPKTEKLNVISFYKNLPDSSQDQVEHQLSDAHLQNKLCCFQDIGSPCLVLQLVLNQTMTLGQLLKFRILRLFDLVHK